MNSMQKELFLKQLAEKNKDVIFSEVSNVIYVTNVDPEDLVLPDGYEYEDGSIYDSEDNEVFRVDTSIVVDHNYGEDSNIGKDLSEEEPDEDEENKEEKENEEENEKEEENEELGDEIVIDDELVNDITSHQEKQSWFSKVKGFFSRNKYEDEEDEEIIIDEEITVDDEIARDITEHEEDTNNASLGSKFIHAMLTPVRWVLDKMKINDEEDEEENEEEISREEYYDLLNDLDNNIRKVIAKKEELAKKVPSDYNLGNLDIMINDFKMQYSSFYKDNVEKGFFDIDLYNATLDNINDLYQEMKEIIKTIEVSEQKAKEEERKQKEQQKEQAQQNDQQQTKQQSSEEEGLDEIEKEIEKIEEKISKIENSIDKLIEKNEKLYDKFIDKYYEIDAKFYGVSVSEYLDMSHNEEQDIVEKMSGKECLDRLKKLNEDLEELYSIMLEEDKKMEAEKAKVSTPKEENNKKEDEQPKNKVQESNDKQKSESQEKMTKDMKELNKNINEKTDLITDIFNSNNKLEEMFIAKYNNVMGMLYNISGSEWEKMTYDEKQKLKSKIGLYGYYENLKKVSKELNDLYNIIEEEDKKMEAEKAKVSTKIEENKKEDTQPKTKVQEANDKQKNEDQEKLEKEIKELTNKINVRLDLITNMFNTNSELKEMFSFKVHTAMGMLYNISGSEWEKKTYEEKQKLKSKIGLNQYFENLKNVYTEVDNLYNLIIRESVRMIAKKAKESKQEEEKSVNDIQPKKEEKVVEITEEEYSVDDMDSEYLVNHVSYEELASNIRKFEYKIMDRKFALAALIKNHASEEEIEKAKKKISKAENKLTQYRLMLNAYLEKQEEIYDEYVAAEERERLHQERLQEIEKEEKQETERKEYEEFWEKASDERLSSMQSYSDKDILEFYQLAENNAMAADIINNLRTDSSILEKELAKMTKQELIDYAYRKGIIVKNVKNVKKAEIVDEILAVTKEANVKKLTK